MRREVLIGVVAAAAGAGAAVLVAGSEQEPSPAGASAALAVVVGWSCVASGIGEHTVEKHVKSIFAAVRRSPSPGDHRRVLAVVRFLDAG